MKTKLVVIPSLETLIQPSPGFKKKELADSKLDLGGLCEAACEYCSSTHGYYLRTHRKEFADLTEAQLGERLLPGQDPSLMMVFDDVIETLKQELSNKRRGFGADKTLIFSMLTDGFSPTHVAKGSSQAALELPRDKTDFRIRILTKQAVVGMDKWVRFFLAHPERFVVGLSCGTVDDKWARRVERRTSSPTARLEALQRLQAAGVATFGMLCPLFPEVLQGRHLDDLIDQTNPSACEHIWAEPYNDRTNWRAVRDLYEGDAAGWNRLTELFEDRRNGAWSRYATELYKRLKQRAKADGWLDKLCYLLYEELITESDALEFAGLHGVLLQSTPDEDGLSQNRAFRALQQAKMRRSA